MVEVEEVVTEVRVDDMDFDRKMRRIDRELESVERDAKRRGRGRGAALVGGIAGAVAGTVAGAAQGNQATSQIIDLLLNLVAAILLPILQQILPLLETALPVIQAASEALTPAARELARAGSEIITVDLLGGEAPEDRGSVGADLFRIFTQPLQLSFALGRGIRDEDRTIAGELQAFGRSQLQAFEDVGVWFADKSSEAWDWGKEQFTGVGGSPPS